jgi:hypothetical protein
LESEENMFERGIHSKNKKKIKKEWVIHILWDIYFTLSLNNYILDKNIEIYVKIIDNCDKIYNEYHSLFLLLLIIINR